MRSFRSAHNYVHILIIQYDSIIVLLFLLNRKSEVMACDNCPLVIGVNVAPAGILLHFS